MAAVMLLSLLREIALDREWALCHYIKALKYRRNFGLLHLSVSFRCCKSCCRPCRDRGNDDEEYDYEDGWEYHQWDDDFLPSINIFLLWQHFDASDLGNYSTQSYTQGMYWMEPNSCSILKVMYHILTLLKKVRTPTLSFGSVQNLCGGWIHLLSHLRQSWKWSA